MGSTGLLLTDDLEMKAVSEDQLDDFCRNSLEAGVDALMVCRSMKKAERLFEITKEFKSEAIEKLMIHQNQCQKMDTVTLSDAKALWSSFTA